MSKWGFQHFTNLDNHTIQEFWLLGRSFFESATIRIYTYIYICAEFIASTVSDLLALITERWRETERERECHSPGSALHARATHSRAA